MNSLPLETQALLAALVKQGVSQRKIASRLNVSRTTVRRYTDFINQGFDITRLDDYAV